MRWQILGAGVLCLAISLHAGTIRLKTRTIDTTREPSGVTLSVERRLHTGRTHRLVEFGAPVNRELLAQLALRGITVTSSAGARALALSIPDNAELEGLPVTWTGQLEPNDKLSRELQSGPGNWTEWVVEFHKDVPKANAVEIVRRSSFQAVRSQALLPNQLLVRGDAGSLGGLALWDEVAYVFPAAADLEGLSGVKPCAGALTTGGTTGQFVQVSTGWTSNGVNGLTLNYVFTTLTDKVSAAQAQSEILRAMREWSKNANLQFVLGTDPAAPWTVAVEFGTSVNNDPTPFDPTGTVLAHTYYPAPPNPEPIAGDLHFNPDEDWHVGASTDIYTVALHELGHALGLGHTDNPGDVMYPYYRFGQPLSVNDIAGVQSLYGLPGGGTTPPPTPLVSLSLQVLPPATGFRTVATSTALSGTLVNASPAATVEWQTSGGASGTASGNTSWSAPNIPLVPGVNLITVSASDAGQTTATRLLRVLRTGTTATAPPPPSSPPPGSEPASLVITSSVAGTTLTVNGTASDPSGIAQVNWQTSSGATGIASGTNTWTASGIPLYPGTNVVIIRAVANSGSSTWVSLTNTR